MIRAGPGPSSAQPLVRERSSGLWVVSFFFLGGGGGFWTPPPPQGWPPRVRMPLAGLDSPCPSAGVGWGAAALWVSGLAGRSGGAEAPGSSLQGGSLFLPFPLARDGGSGRRWQKPAGSRFVLCKRMLMAGPAMR